MIVDDGKLPLVLGFIAFIVTFLVTRTIVRMIRAGKGPFKNNVSESGLHIHHVVPGVLILIVGGFLAAGGARHRGPWASIGAVLVGVGAGLVLDEFALILTLDDVYWAKEGRVSVARWSALAAASLGIFLVFGSPFAPERRWRRRLAHRRHRPAPAVRVHHVPQGQDPHRRGRVRSSPSSPSSGAIRLARPGSRWAKRFYKPKKLARATTRASTSDARWAPVANWFGDTVAGSVNDPETAPSPH